MPTEQFANNAQTTLAAAVPAAVAGAPGTITVSAATGFPAGPQFRVRVGDELMLVTAVAGTTWTVTRGIEGTAAAAHAAGDTVTQVLTAGALAAVTALPHRPTGRLTTETGVVVSAADRTAQGTLFYTSGTAFLYDGAQFRPYTFGELTVPLSGLPAGTNYDVFLWDDGGTPALKIGPAWADSGGGTSARGMATELEAVGGLWVNKAAVAGGPAARAGLYLGTVRTSGAGVTEDSRARNQVPPPLLRRDSAASWTYMGGYRQAGAQAANQVEAVVGLAGAAADLSALVLSTLTGGASHVAIGADSITPHPDGTGGQASSNATVDYRLCYRPAPGYHAWLWLEKADTTNTFYGMGRFGLVGTLAG